MLFIKHELFYSNYTFIFEKPKYKWKKKHDSFYSNYTFISEKPKYKWKVAEVILLWITFFIYSLPQYVTSIFFSILLWNIISVRFCQTRKVEKLPLYHIFHMFCVQYKLNILVFYMYPLIRVVGLLFQFKIVIMNLYIDTNKCDVIYWKILY